MRMRREVAAIWPRRNSNDLKYQDGVRCECGGQLPDQARRLARVRAELARSAGRTDHCTSVSRRVNGRFVEMIVRSWRSAPGSFRTSVRAGNSIYAANAYRSGDANVLKTDCAKRREVAPVEAVDQSGVVSSFGEQRHAESEIAPILRRQRQQHSLNTARTLAFFALGGRAERR